MPNARLVMKNAARLVDRLRRPPRGVTVLIYHRVGRRSAIEVDLPTALFADQMAELAASRRVVSLDDALVALDGPPPASPVDDPVVLTFDDGTADFATDVVPVLVCHQLPVTLYVATDFVERGRDFPDAGHPVSWSGLADAVSTGLVTIGSHTHTHALLDRLDPAGVVDELDRSCGLIHDRLGVEAAHFAYPKAVPGSPAAAAEVRRRFRSAALARTRPNRYGHTDRFRLTRSPIQVSDDMAFFRAKAAGGLWAEDTARQALNRVRYRGRAS